MARPRYCTRTAPVLRSTEAVRLVGMILLVAGSICVLHTANAYTGNLYVHVDNDNVTVQASEIALGKVLQELSRQTGLVITAREPLDVNVTLTIADLTMPEAIRQLLRGYSFTLAYDASSRVNRLWVLPSPPVQPQPQQIDHQSNGRQAATRLRIALADQDSGARMDSISALPESSSEQITSVLAIAAVNDSVPSVRAEAINALGDMGHENVLPVVQQAIQDSEVEVREAAVAALVEIGGDQSARSLGFAMSGADGELRTEFVDALGEIGGPAALRILEQALTDTDENVRDAARQAIEEISGE